MIPAISVWATLTRDEKRRMLSRPDAAGEDVTARVEAIVLDVQKRGDAAVLELTRELDGASLSSLAVTPGELAAAESAVPEDARRALARAIANVQAFHEAQRPQAIRLEPSSGMRLERLAVPLEAVGIYVPSGSAPLPSAVIMSAVPAKVAGCTRRIVCAPPRADGSLDPAILVAARMCEATEVFKMGGAQAIAALAFGTESVPKVDKIFGPGNRFVTAAKLLVARSPRGAAIDLPAGPSEVCVIADEQARIDFVAADLLAQAEHDPLAHVVLITTSPNVANALAAELERQASRLSRRDVIVRALGNARVIVVSTLEEAFAVSNEYAPEHLVLEVRNARSWIDRVRAAGSVFLGPWTCEPLGDYCSGGNHVLPTYGFARAYSGLGTSDFLRFITVQDATADALRDLGPVAMRLADLEGLDGHASAVRVRLDALAAGGQEEERS